MKKRYILLPILGMFIILLAGLVINKGNLFSQKPLSREQIEAQNIKELTEFMPQEYAQSYAGLTANFSFRHPMLRKFHTDFALITAKTALLQSLYGDEVPADLPPHVQEKIENLNNVVRRQLKRMEENEELEEKYYQKEHQRWLKTLPLHKSRLTFAGPNGQQELSHKQVECPARQDLRKSQKSVCYEYQYAGNDKSVFELTDDVLTERNDFQNDLHAYRYTFTPPPFFKDAEHLSFSAHNSDRAASVARFTAAYLEGPQKELFYGPDGVLSSSTEIDLSHKMQIQTSYMSPTHEFGYQLRQTLSTSSRHETSTQGNPFMEITIELPATPDAPHTYTLTVSDGRTTYSKKGEWMALLDHVILLDNGRKLPPATDEPRAPRYCDIYPNGCKE